MFLYLSQNPCKKNSYSDVRFIPIPSKDRRKCIILATRYYVHFLIVLKHFVYLNNGFVLRKYVLK